MPRFWKYLSFLAGSLLLPAAAMAAFNDVVVNSDQATVTLPGTNKSYTLTRSTRVQSFTVNQTSIDFVMLSGSLVEIISTDRHPFVVSTGCEIIEQICNSTQSRISVQCTDVSKTITITPTNGSVCDTTGGGSGGSGGSGGGGGGRSTVPLTTTPSTPEAARVVVNVSVERPTPVTVGSSSHTVTVLSASAQTVTVRIASEPVTVTLAQGEIKDVDTNADGKNDLRVRYVGLSAGQPQLEFIELAAAAVSTPLSTVPCALEKQMAYKQPGSSAVYYITENCAKRPFNNSRVFFTYLDRWADVKVTSKATLDSIPKDTLGFMPWGPKFDPQYGALVKIVTDPKTYLLLGTEKYWITSEDVFIKLGYQWNWIEDIDQRLLDKYTTGSEINYTNRHPNFTLVKYAGDPKVYRLEANKADAAKQVRRHIKDEKAFKALKYRWDRIVTLPASEQYADGDQLAAQ